jgi:hypothetical protein
MAQNGFESKWEFLIFLHLELRGIDNTSTSRLEVKKYFEKVRTKRKDK